MTQEEFLAGCELEAAHRGLDMQLYRTETGVSVGFIQYYRTWTDTAQIHPPFDNGGNGYSLSKSHNDGGFEM